MIPTTDQYRIIVSGAGWAERAARGRIGISGPDAVAFLQALVTNDVERLAIGEGTYTAYLTPQGRMVADLEIYRRPESVVASVAPGMAGMLTARFDSLIFAENVQVTDRSAETVEILVVGGKAGEILAKTFHLEEAQLSGLSDYSQLDVTDGFVARATEATLPSFKIVATSGRRNDIISRLESAGAIAMAESLVESLRVDAGRPAFGVDMTGETIPLEAGLLDRAISTTKGCYVGQEVIIRVLHRGGGRVAKRLVALALDVANGDEPPEKGTTLRHDGRDLGQLTSVVPSPDGARWIALGYAHRDSAEIGRAFDVGSSSVTATITGLAS